MQELTKQELSYKDRQVIAVIKSVSASGMTRKIDFYVNNGDRLENINDFICKVANYKLDKNYRIIVNGCGMDMIFSVLSNFNYAISSIIDGKQTNNYSTYFFNANNYQLL